MDGYGFDPRADARRGFLEGAPAVYPGRPLIMTMGSRAGDGPPLCGHVDPNGDCPQPSNCDPGQLCLPAYVPINPGDPCVCKPPD